MISHESRLSHNENGGKVLEIEWGLFFATLLANEVNLSLFIDILNMDHWMILETFPI